jgi:hypothetical protein
MALVFIARNGMGASYSASQNGRCVALKKKPCWGCVGTGDEEHGNGSTFSE